MKRKLMSVVIALLPALVVFMVVASSSTPTQAAPAAPSAVLNVWPGYVPADGGAAAANCLAQGTPFAIRATISEPLSPTQKYVVKIRLGTQACVWNPQTGVWNNDSTAYTALPQVTADSNGVASFWLYGRSTNTGSTSLTIRARACTSPTCSTNTGVNIDSSAQTVVTMSMSTGGGWIEGHAYDINGTLLNGARVVVRNSISTIIGIYSTEDNGVTDTYPTANTGYYRVAAPIGNGYTAEVWDSTNNIIGTATTGVSVAAASTTSAVDINKLDEANLSVNKMGPAAVSASDSITYTINLSNTGFTTATTTILTDTFPSEVSFVTYTTAIPVTFTQMSPTQLVWELGDVAATTATLSIQVQGVVSSSIANGILFTNTITASTAYTETNLGNNTAKLVTLVGSPDLAVIKTGPSAGVNVGDPVTFTITYSNAGTLDASGVTLVDRLPIGFSYVSDSLGGAITSTSAITWNIGTLGADGAQNSFVLTTTAAPYAGDYQNQVAISGTPADTILRNNTATSTVTINGIDPYVTKSGPTALFGGDVVSYTVTYGNHGNQPTGVVTVTDDLPDGFTVANDTSGLNVIVNTAATRVWTTTLPAASGPFTFTLALSVPTSIAMATPVTNVVTIDSSGEGNSPTNDMASASGKVYQLTPILDVQQVANPAVSDTSPLSGTWIAVQGVVIANPGSFLSTSGVPYRYYIEDPAGGPWSGLYIYKGTLNPPTVKEGDLVRLYGFLTEYSAQGGSQQTELDISQANALQLVVSTGNPLPAPAVLTTAQLINAATAEQWESVLVEFQNAHVTNPSLGNGEWNFDDGSGATIGDDNAKGGNNTVLTYVPQLNDYYSFIRGIGWQSFGTYKLEPRYNADVNLAYPVTFVYHDVEDAIHPGEDVQLRGDFTNWDTNPITLSHDAGYTIFTTTLVFPTNTLQNYRYFVPTAGANGYTWLNNFADRFTVPPSTEDDYRLVRPDAAQLLGPASMLGEAGKATSVVSATVFITGVTDFDSNPGRAIKAEVGYGTAPDPALWTWSPLTFAAKSSGSDLYTGVFTPTSTGIYSYAVRFNANWGTGDPMADGWSFAGLDGLPLTPDKAGVLTVTAPNLSIAKSVAAPAKIDLGNVVTYTIVLTNSGDGTATNVMITDTLPAQVTFGGFVTPNGAVYAAGVITRSGDIATSTQVQIVFTATVGMARTYYGQTVSNTAQFAAGNGGSGVSTPAAFKIQDRYFIFLPLVKRSN
jgi:uncharacterized repeat protein (TIGR01451 family)